VTWDDWVAWYEQERGITRLTLAAFGLYGGEDGEVVIPYPKGTKYRSGSGPDRHMWWEKGSTQTLYPGPTNEGMTGTAFLVEGETDTMKLWQETGGKVAVFGLPGVTSWKPEWANEFKQFDRVYVVLDNDAEYTATGNIVDSAWLQIRGDLGTKAHRVTLPTGVKDICVFFEQYDVDDFKTLLRSPAPSKYRALDFSKMNKPMHTDWMVKGLIGQGDICIWFGPPYVGKSVLSMSLAAALTTGQEAWLGLPLLKHGRVLYIDEENPENVILSRLQRLGVRPEHSTNLRYLHEQSVRLDRDPDTILQEALNFDPVCIFIDSMTRIHTKDENNAGEMAALFNDGIKPLARRTGATVILLHHANKVEDGNAYRRMRGSADLGGVIDNGLDVQMANAPGFVTIEQFKIRNGLPHEPIFARFQDTESGLRVVTNAEAPPPF